MRQFFAVLSLVCAIAAAACNRDRGAADPPDGENGGASAGRLAWDQPVDDPGNTAGLRFMLWIDGIAVELAAVTCGQPIDSSATCTGPLPRMMPGHHTLALSVILPTGAESPSSEPLTISVGANGAVNFLHGGDGIMLLAGGGEGPRGPFAAGAESPAGPLAAAHAGVVDPAVSVERLWTGLRRPTDLAVVDDGRLLVAEQDGTVRELTADGPRAQPALTLEDVNPSAGGLLGLAVDVDHVRNGFVFLAYTADTGFRVARYRLVDAVLGEGAVLFETVLESPVTKAVLRSGPDGLVYVAIDNGGDERRGGDLGSYGGKLLRLDRNGGIPDAQAGYGPTYLADLQSPAALTWGPRTHQLWIADAGSGAGGTLSEVREATSGGPGRFANVISRLAVPDGDEPTVAQTYRGAAIAAWDGNLLLGLKRSGQLWRVVFGEHTIGATHVVLDGTLGPIGSMAISKGGYVYLTAGSSLLRLTGTR